MYLFISILLLCSVNVVFIYLFHFVIVIDYVSVRVIIVTFMPFIIEFHV